VRLSARLEIWLAGECWSSAEKEQEVSVGSCNNRFAAKKRAYKIQSEYERDRNDETVAIVSANWINKRTHSTGSSVVSRVSAGEVRVQLRPSLKSPKYVGKRADKADRVRTEIGLVCLGKHLTLLACTMQQGNVEVATGAGELFGLFVLSDKRRFQKRVWD
jgi:hypothetical protein